MPAEPFESPEALIGYFELHSQTERALFHWTHIRDLMKLAGRPGYPPVLPLRNFWAFRWEDNAHLIKLARLRLMVKAQPGTRLIIFGHPA